MKQFQTIVSNNNKPSPKLFVTYRNTLEFTSSIIRHKPISLIKCKQQNHVNTLKIGCVTDRNKVYFLKNIIYIKTENYLNIFQIERFSTLEDLQYQVFVEDDIEEYLVAFPYKFPYNYYQKKYYSFVSKSGLELQKDFSMAHSIV